MPAIQLQLNNPLPFGDLPQFDMPDKYKADIWNVKEWDIYKKASSKTQERWDKRSKITDYKFDFTLCKNLYVREEFKFLFYLAIEKEKLSVGAIGDKYDHFKNFSKFINDNWMQKTTIVDDNISKLFETYLITTLKLKPIISNGSCYSILEGAYKNCTKRAKSLTFLETCIFTLQRNDKSLTLMDRDIWLLEDLYPNESKTGRRYDFSSIKNSEYKIFAKKYCKQRANSLNCSTITNHLLYIKLFMCWLQEEYPDIIHMNMLNREILEEYFFWLRIETELSSHNANLAILYLKVFLEYGQLLNFENFLSDCLILKTDYSFKGHNESQYFTEEELASIMNIVPKMPLVIGNIVCSLIATGLRISEILSLTTQQIVKRNNNYILLIYQFKTNNFYEMPITNEFGEFLESIVKRNKKKFGCEPEYVFLRDDNTKVPYAYCIKYINKCIAENNLLDRNGNLLRCNTHRFRATKATMLINCGMSAKETSQALGHTNLSALSSYAAVNNETLQETLRPRFDKINIMIKNIGKTENIVEEPLEDAIPLCNGFCSKPLNTGICAKANACLECSLFVPSNKYLTAYKLQLNEVNATLTVAKTNNHEKLISKLEQDKKSLELTIERVESALEEINNE